MSSDTGNGRGRSPWVYISVVVIGVVAILVAYFAFLRQEPIADTNPASAEVDARPTGAGTRPEGQADTVTDGVTDQLDEVDPAAPGEETIPPAEEIEDLGRGDGPVDGDFVSPQTPSDPDAGNVDVENVTGQGTNPPLDDPDQQGETPMAPDDAETGEIENPSDGQFPAGRDAQTDLSPEDGQDVIRDTDTGGTPVVPTPSGPEGRDDNPYTAE